MVETVCSLTGVAGAETVVTQSHVDKCLGNFMFNSLAVQGDDQGRSNYVRQHFNTTGFFFLLVDILKKM